MYTGLYQPKPDNVLGILYIAKMYETQGLAKICSDYVVSVMGPENAVTLCNSALNLGYIFVFMCRLTTNLEKTKYSKFVWSSSEQKPMIVCLLTSVSHKQSLQY